MAKINSMYDGKYPVTHIVTAMGTAALGLALGYKTMCERTAAGAAANPLSHPAPIQQHAEAELKSAEGSLYDLDIVNLPSPNYRDTSSREINTIVLHTTEGSGIGAISWLRDPASGVSAHYVVKKDGSIARLVDDEDVAWHVRGYNDHSIGIEIAGTYTEPMTSEQVESVGKLIMNLQQEYKIKTQNILPHSQLDPGRRKDPGEQNMKAVLDYIRSQ